MTDARNLARSHLRQTCAWARSAGPGLHRLTTSSRPRSRSTLHTRRPGRFAEPEPGVGQQSDEQLVRRRAFRGQLGDLRVGQDPPTASLRLRSPDASATLRTSRPSRTASARHCPRMSTACRVIESPTTVPSSAAKATTSACVIAFSGSPGADTWLVPYPPAGESGPVRPRSAPPWRGALAAWRMSLRSGMLGSWAPASPFAEPARSLA